MEDRYLKRLRKKARKGLRGWPIATIAFYGPNLSRATKVTVGIVPSENAEVEELRAWKVDDGEIRADPRIAREISEFIEERQVPSVAMTDGIIGCPHQEGIDYEGERCPFLRILARTRSAPLGMRVIRMRASLISAPVAFSHSCKMASARGSTSIGSPNALATQSEVMSSRVGPIPPVVKTYGRLEKFLSPSPRESDSVTARGNERMERASHGAEGLFRC